jgi:exodeoxyribonuclease V beta subunit
MANGLTTVTAKLATQKIEYAPFLEVMRSRYFFGWAKTSFTALARQLDESTQIMAVVDERIDDAIDIETKEPVGVIDSNEGFELGCDLELKREDDIRFTFVKGANAGTFLHEIFEKIDFNNQSQWSQVIDRTVSSYQLPLIYSSAEQQQRVLQANKKQNSQSVDTDTIVASQHEALMGWIKEVLQTPLLASNQPLESIDTTQRFAELEFNMGLSEHFRAEDITTLFAEHLPNEPDKHVTLVAQNKAHLYRYLRGEIDLVYEHAGKYYVVDYKSNYLGNSLSSYDKKTLKQAMSKAGYWLQAAIYQVALHRFLSMRVSDYDGNEDKYLGPVEYVFLRGVYHADASTSDSALDSARRNKTNTADCNVVTNKRFGLVIWDIPIDFIKALDTLLGLPD